MRAALTFYGAVRHSVNSGGTVAPSRTANYRKFFLYTHYPFAYPAAMRTPAESPPERRKLTTRLQPWVEALYKLILASAAAVAIWRGLHGW